MTSLFLNEMATKAVTAALSSVGLEADPVFLACPRPEFGDIALASAMPAAKALKRSPKSIADDIAVLIDDPMFARVQVAMPGYVNLTFSEQAVIEALEKQISDPKHGYVAAAAPEKVVLDFGGPNIKPMHVGHMRSLVIGESLRRILLEAGHDVVSDIHLGDWGLPSGKILSEMKHLGLAAETVDPEALASLYPDANARCEADPEALAEAKKLTAALQAGDSELNREWDLVVEKAKAAIKATCDRLGVHFDLWLGEKDAQPKIASFLASVERSGAARKDGNALVMDLDGGEKQMPPVVLVKEDGSSLYATTDLATVVMRMQDIEPDRILYVVDARQEIHFRQVFSAAAKSGVSGDAVLEHIGFGTVNGSDGRPFRTRAGGVMSLNDLLDTAVDSAHKRLVASGRAEWMSEDQMSATAEAIGISALRIADLSSGRMSGYVLDLEKATAFEGKTGPYLLYALVRLRAALAKAGEADAGADISLATPEERRLALAVLGYADALKRSIDGYAPSELVSWAFELASAIGSFYGACPVSSESDVSLKASRIKLCSAAEAVLSKALELLGCKVPDAM